MPTADLGKRFLGTTRGQIVALLRRGARTVEQLARSLGLTDNAVRNHLGTLERDRIVRAEGVRRSPGAGKPAVLYEVHPDAEPLLSRAYAPVLSTMMDVLADTLPPDQVDALLREVGRRLAPELGGRAGGSLDERAAAAAALLQALGGEVDVVKEDGALRLRGYACPLSVAVSRRPEVCRAVEALVAELVQAPVRQCCEHDARPRCGFVVGPAR
jgi:predicted ArsR family transcriptional regulator